MKKRAAQIAIWAVAIFLAARLTWTAAQHDMPVLDTATISIFALYSGRAGFTHFARIIAATRQNGATR